MNRVSRSIRITGICRVGTRETITRATMAVQTALLLKRIWFIQAVAGAGVRAEIGQGHHLCQVKKAQEEEEDLTIEDTMINVMIVLLLNSQDRYTLISTKIQVTMNLITGTTLPTTVLQCLTTTDVTTTTTIDIIAVTTGTITSTTDTTTDTTATVGEAVPTSPTRGASTIATTTAVGTITSTHIPREETIIGRRVHRAGRKEGRRRADIRRAIGGMRTIRTSRVIGAQIGKWKNSTTRTSSMKSRSTGEGSISKGRFNKKWGRCKPLLLIHRAIFQLRRRVLKKRVRLIEKSCSRLTNLTIINNLNYLSHSKVKDCSRIKILIDIIFNLKILGIDISLNEQS